MTGNRHIIHVDMDAFYASVEQLDQPGLAGKAVIVGGPSAQRGVVSAASYEARQFGVHSAMPMAQAVKLCPQAVVLPVRMARYADLSRQIHAIFQQYTPQIEPISLDEAFLDVTDSLGLFGCAEKIGRDIKDTIKSNLGLVASVGIASNKFLAKLASDLDKPDGFVIIYDNNRQAILDPLPVSRIWGIGAVTTRALNAAGLQTIGQLTRTPGHALTRILGNQTQHILDLAEGRDDRAVESDRDTKSISSEQTFAADTEDREFLVSILLHQVEEVSYRLRASHLQARTLTLKLRDSHFKTLTRSHTLDHPTDLTHILWQEAQAVFLQWHAKSARALRLLGFGVSGLSVEGSGQGQLFADPEEEKQKKLDKALDAIRNRYGKDALKHGQ
ncbi:MAG: DNA polymerase IV [Phycisphaerae bacterium]|nr:DNA polymerase IV [Phycisphaerae bacterium]